MFRFFLFIPMRYCVVAFIFVFFVTKCCTNSCEQTVVLLSCPAFDMCKRLHETLFGKKKYWLCVSKRHHPHSNETASEFLPLAHLWHQTGRASCGCFCGKGRFHKSMHNAIPHADIAKKHHHIEAWPHYPR